LPGGCGCSWGCGLVQLGVSQVITGVRLTGGLSSLAASLCKSINEGMGTDSPVGVVGQALCWVWLTRGYELTGIPFQAIDSPLERAGSAITGLPVCLLAPYTNCLTQHCTFSHCPALELPVCLLALPTFRLKRYCAFFHLPPCTGVARLPLPPATLCSRALLYARP